MRLVILCEGDTEQRVLKEFLAPFTQKFTGVEIYNAHGNSKLAYEFKEIAEIALSEDINTRVLCLIDLLQAPFSFPKSVDENAELYLARYTYIKHHMESRIEERFRERFSAFPIVMEIETWLLADVNALNEYLRHRIKPYPSPESVTNPAEELTKLVKRHRGLDYSKTIDGNQLFRKTNAQTVYDDNCPHFVAIVNHLLQLQSLDVSKPAPVYELPDYDLFLQLESLQKQLDDFWQKVDESNELSDADCLLHNEIEAEIEVVCQKIAQSHQS